MAKKKKTYKKKTVDINKSLKNLSKCSITRKGSKIEVSVGSIDSHADKLVYSVEITNDGRNWKKLKVNGKKVGGTYNTASPRSFNIPFDSYHQKANDGKPTLKGIRVKVHAKTTKTTYSNSDKKSTKDKKKKIEYVYRNKWEAGLKTKEKCLTYDVKVPKNVDTAISFSTDGLLLTYGYDNPDDNIMSNNKHTIFRQTYCMLRAIVQGSKNWKTLKNYEWSSADSKSFIYKVPNINIPTKYQVLARSHGPAGVQEYDPKSSKTGASRKEIVVAQPNTPILNGIVRTHANTTEHFYKLSANVQGDEWHPVDNGSVHIQYADYGEVGETKNWTNVDLAFSTNINNQSFSLPRPAANSRRIFRIQTARFGMYANSKDSLDMYNFWDISDLTEISGMNIELQSVGGKEVLHISWDLPNVKFKDASLMIYRYPTGNSSKQVKVTPTPIEYNSGSDSKWQQCYVDYDITDMAINKETFRFELTMAGPGKYGVGAVRVNSYIVGVSIPSIVRNLKAQKFSNSVAKLTWDNRNLDTSMNGLQVAWSTSLYDIEENSTASISTHEFSNASLTSCLVTDLSTSETYYFWVRAFIKKGDVYTYAPWSVHSKTIVMENGVEKDYNGPLYLTEEPTNPVFAASRSWINKDGTVAFEWNYTSPMPQTTATIYAAYMVDPRQQKIYLPVYTVNGDVRKATVTFNTFKAYELYVKVRISNIAGYVDSDPIKIIVSSNPEFTFSSTSITSKEYTSTEDVDGTDTPLTMTRNELNSLPLSVTALTENDANTLIFRIVNVKEFEWLHPYGTEYLYPGDCVYTTELSNGTTEIDDVRLADGNWYRMEVDCVNNDTGLKAKTKSIEFFVNWTKQAKAPSDSEIEINEEGNVVITPIKPEGANDTDICNIYRNTVDGVMVCQKDSKWGIPLTDSLPTFGLLSDDKSQSYRIALKTKEGDEAWYDVEYTMDDISGTIITYGNSEVHLPWDVEYSDDRTKSGELREHLGGTKLYYSKPYISVSHSISAKIVKGMHDDILQRLYELSRYTGICYVRTSRSMAFTASVDVSISQNYNDPIVSISLSLTECDPNGEYELETLDESTE